MMLAARRCRGKIARQVRDAATRVPPACIGETELGLALGYLSPGDIARASEVSSSWVRTARSDGVFFNAYESAFSKNGDGSTSMPHSSLYQEYTSRIVDPHEGDQVEALWKGSIKISYGMNVYGTLWRKGRVSLKWQDSENGEMYYAVTENAGGGASSFSKTTSDLVVRKAEIRQPVQPPLCPAVHFAVRDKVEVFLECPAVSSVAAAAGNNGPTSWCWLIGEVRRVKQDALLVHTSHDMWVKRSLCRHAPGPSSEEGAGLRRQRSKWPMRWFWP